MPLLQIALDFIDSAAASDLLARISPAIDVVEAGTPMIKREGIGVLRLLRQAAPHKLLVADLKTMDAGAYEADLAFNAGADVMTVLACASDETIRAALSVAAARGKSVVADLIGVPDQAGRAQQLAQLGVHYIGIHTGADEQAGGADPLANLAAVRAAVPTPLVVAGGINADNIGPLLTHDPAIVIVGSYITRADDPVAAVRALRIVMERVSG
jgi:3-hexulose-6-phosphate synthase